MPTPRPIWRKSSRSGTASGGGGAQCVEISRAPGAVRDSTNPHGPMLVVDLPQLLAAVKAGRFGR